MPSIRVCTYYIAAQVFLQAYIFVRQTNPFNVLAPLQHTSVSPLLLLFSLGSSGKASMEGISKLSRYADLQAGGDKWRFLRRMLQFGEGLAPTNILQDLATREMVTITSDLAGVDTAGLLSICLAARRSQTLRELSLRGDVLARMYEVTSDKVAIENALLELFRNLQLTHLSVSGQLPAYLAELMKGQARAHPRLSRLEIGTEGEASAVVCRSRIVEELGAAPRHMACIVEGDLRGLSAALRTSDDDALGAELGGPLTLASTYGHAAILQLLLLRPSSGLADPKQADRSGTFPLLLAAIDGHQ